jgi:hypothetical protein
LIYIPTTDVGNWRNYLADPKKQWVRGFSAFELAHSWMQASKSNFPVSVEQLFAVSGTSVFRELEPISMFPEHRVHLDTNQAPSQNDLFVLARNATDLMVIMVEGKVDETFGPTVAAWLKEASDGKMGRLQFLLGQLNITDIDKDLIHSLRYQLLHRTTSALLEARRYHARQAMVLVHSFSDRLTGLLDYQSFLALFGIEGKANTISGPLHINGIDLWFGWLADRKVSDIDRVWQNLIACEGQTFTQIRGGEFNYQVRGKYLLPDRTLVQISKKSIEEALQYLPLMNTTVLQHLRAPSYLFALLTDKRIIGRYNDSSEER